MKKRSRVILMIRPGLALLALLIFVSGFAPVNFVDPIQAGKEIYTKGSSPSGQEIFALMSGVKVPATVLPCVNCHGPDGKGQPEGGVTPSNINWEILSKNNGGQFSDRRKHPPYTEKHLKRAITMGLDPAGNELLKTMPQYQMSLEDINYLLTYLKQLGKEQEKGIDGSTIKTGFFLPSERVSKGKREALQKIIEAYFSEINHKGGIYNRTFEISFFSDLDGANLDSPLDSCFALAACFDFEGEQNLTDWADKHEIPVTGVVSKWPTEQSLDNQYVFYLYPGLDRQSYALIEFISSRTEPESLNIALLHSESFSEKKLINSLEDACLGLHPNHFKKIALSPDITEFSTVVQQLKSENISHVFYIGPPGSENQFLEAARLADWFPDFYSPGTLSGISPFKIPKEFDQKIFLSYPTWFSELTDQGIELYTALKAKYDLPDVFQNNQLLALGSAILYVEAIRNCGRKLTRQKLIEQLESLYEFKTGLMPPISYGLNTRMGSKKVYITSVNLESTSLTLETIIE